MAGLIPAAGDPPPSPAIDMAAAALAAGEVVGVPTDTVYGLAAHAGVAGATARVFELKGRPAGLALPVLLADAGQAGDVCEGLAGDALVLARRFWPGALTIVVRRRAGSTLDLGGDPSKVGLRCPDHPVIRALCSRVGPLPTTSANLHGRAALTTAPDVVAAFPGLLVLDAGPCDHRPSTVVDCTGPDVTLVRDGAVAWAEVLAALERAPRPRPGSR